jgi:hypothetical protein
MLPELEFLDLTKTLDISATGALLGESAACCVPISF